MENLVREMRQQRGWSQQELGQRLGVSRQTIHSIESGRYDPSLKLAFRISAVFDRPLDAIFRP